MQAQTLRFLALCTANSLLALLLLIQSIAESDAVTSATPVHLSGYSQSWNLVGWLRPYTSPTPTVGVPKAVASVSKRKVTVFPITPSAPTNTLVAQVTPTNSAAPSVNLLPVVSHTDVHPNQQLLADTVLRTLPSGCRDNLKNFYVRYDHPANRGLGGKTTMIVDGSAPDTEFMALIVHECGHVIHGNWAGSPASGASAFRDGTDLFYKDSPVAAFFALSWENENVLKASAHDQDFASIYGKTNSFEDFAEDFTLYMTNEPYFEAQARVSTIMALKLQWMRTYLPKTHTMTNGMAVWDGSVPWDATKLPFTWLAKA